MTYDLRLQTYDFYFCLKAEQTEVCFTIEKGESFSTFAFVRFTFVIVNS